MPRRWKKSKCWIKGHNIAVFDGDDIIKHYYCQRCGLTAYSSDAKGFIEDTETIYRTKYPRRKVVFVPLMRGRIRTIDTRFMPKRPEIERLQERLAELVNTINKWNGGGAGSSYGTLNDLRLILWRWRHPDRVTKQ